MSFVELMKQILCVCVMKCVLALVLKSCGAVVEEMCESAIAMKHTCGCCQWKVMLGQLL